MSPIYIANGNKHTTLTSHISANNDSLLATVVLETSAIISSEGLHRQFVCSNKAVISLARIRIHKYTKDGFSSLRRKKRFAEMKNRHLCICYVRKVISLDEFTDTHYKMTRSLFVNS